MNDSQLLPPVDADRILAAASRSSSLLKVLIEGMEGAGGSRLGQMMHVLYGALTEKLEDGLIEDLIDLVLRDNGCSNDEVNEVHSQALSIQIPAVTPNGPQLCADVLNEKSHRGRLKLLHRLCRAVLDVAKSEADVVVAFSEVLEFGFSVYIKVPPTQP